MSKAWRAVTIVLIGLLMTMAVPAQEEEGALAKQSQNPVGNLISLPFENNTYFDVGPEDAIVNTLFLKPVYPINLSGIGLAKWNLINRGIIPITYQEERFEGEGSEFGLGDITYQGFFSPAQPGKVIWGFGPAITFPTATDDRLGTDKWSAGPAVVVLAMPGRWVVGGLVSHAWSFAGDDDREDVSLSSLQYFINYNFPSGWYFSSTPIMTYNWEADSGNRWTIPVGGGFGRLIKIGKLPVDCKLQAFYNVEAPEYASDWSIQLTFKFLFPKGKPAPAE